MFGRVVKAGALSFLLLAPVALIGGSDQRLRFELCGILNFGAKGVFNLRDQENDTVRWVELGQSINGYRIEEYDSESKTLTLVSSNETLNITLEKESFPVGIFSPAHLGSAEVPEAKRPPRPRIREFSNSISSRSAEEPTVGVLNTNRRTVSSRLKKGSESTQSGSANPENGESSHLPGNAAIQAKNRIRGQLTYELKVRPPIRIESTELRTKSAE